VLKPVVNLREIGKQNSIFFGFDKYNVTQNQWKKVIYIANALKEHPDVDVVVEGYADKRGKASYNYKLTEKRVNSVVNLLIKQGIDKNRIIELPMGSTTPIIKCVKCTEAQNAQNRRVLFDFKTE